MPSRRRTLGLLLASLAPLAGCGPAAESRETAAERAYPPEGQFIDLGGLRVHAVVRGSGPDLVLIHGASGNTRDFTFSLTKRLTGRYRVIVFDRPGLGWSDGGADSPQQQARILQAAAARLGAQKPLVLGQSYGGAVALAWALERPANIAGLIPVSAVSNPWPGELGPQYAVLASGFGGAVLAPVISASASNDRAAAALRYIFAPQRPPAGYAEYVGVGLALRRETLRANARQLDSLKPHVTAMSKRYGTIRVPTEIVHGIADRIVGIELHSDILAQQIPGARLVRLPGIGHMPHHVAQADVIAAIDRAARRAGLK